MPLIEPGQKAPAFSLRDQQNKTHTLADYAGRPVVLYFYPKDDTPGCTTEACAFRDAMPKFDSAKLRIYGISADDDKRHAKFVAKHALNFPLIADPERHAIEGFGVWVEKSLYGRKYMGIARATFAIDANGKVEQVWDKVKPKSHADEVLAWATGAATTPAR